MRISTRQIYQQGLEAFGQQQVKLANLQQQISSGTRINKPSDDPAGSAQILQLEQTISLHEQYQQNILQADTQLSAEETTLASVETVIFRLKELAIQGNNAAIDQSGMQAIAVEVGERMQELLSLANARDGNGEYFFSGYQKKTQPFNQTLTGSIPHVVYNGDQGQRSLQISESRQITVDNPGSDVFLKIPSATALNQVALSTNAGSGVLAPAHVFDASAYVAGNYEIRFTTPGTYDVFDVSAGANIVSNVTYTAGADIDFNGTRTSITGAPAAGDVFSVSQGQYRDIFDSVQTFTDTLSAPVNNAQKQANIGNFITDLDSFLSRVLEVRTDIGGRMNTLDTQQESNEANIAVTQSTLSKVRDTDLAAAISQLTLEQTTLDAAQAVFARITSSSLFNFLR